MTCTRPIKMSLLCQIEMTLLGGFAELAYEPSVLKRARSNKGSGFVGRCIGRRASAALSRGSAPARRSTPTIVTSLSGRDSDISIWRTQQDQAPISLWKVTRLSALPLEQVFLLCSRASNRIGPEKSRLERADDPVLKGQLPLAKEVCNRPPQELRRASNVALAGDGVSVRNGTEQGRLLSAEGCRGSPSSAANAASRVPGSAHRDCRGV